MKKQLKLNDDKDIINLIQIKSSKYIAHLVNKNNYFEYDLAQIKPFL